MAYTPADIKLGMNLFSTWLESSCLTLSHIFVLLIKAHLSITLWECCWAMLKHCPDALRHEEQLQASFLKFVRVARSDMSDILRLSDTSFCLTFEERLTNLAGASPHAPGHLLA